MHFENSVKHKRSKADANDLLRSKKRPAGVDGLNNDSKPPAKKRKGRQVRSKAQKNKKSRDDEEPLPENS